MAPNSGIARLLRFMGILFMAATAVYTLLGGAGTVCVTINPTGFSASMALLAPFQWLYVLFMLSGVVLGVYGILVSKPQEFANEPVFVNSYTSPTIKWGDAQLVCPGENPDHFFDLSKTARPIFVPSLYSHCPS